MALKYYEHKETQEIKRFLSNPGDEWIEVLTAPNHKLMVPANKATGTSKMKDSEKMLRERARNYARDVEGDDHIAFNRANGLETQVKQGLLNGKGERRKKIDDI